MFLSKISWAVGTVCVLAVLTLATGRVVSDAPTDARVRPQAAPAPAEQPKGEEKTVHLDRAKDELLVQEKRLHEIETMFSQELTDARAQLLELTEKLRAAERKRDMDVAVLQRRREQLEHSTPAIVDLREKIN